MSIRTMARVVPIPAGKAVLVATTNLKRRTWTIKNPSTTVTFYFGADQNISTTTGISIATGSSAGSPAEEKWLNEVWGYAGTAMSIEFIEVIDDSVLREDYIRPADIEIPDIYAGKSLQHPDSPTRKPFGLERWL